MRYILSTYWLLLFGKLRQQELTKIYNRFIEASKQVLSIYTAAHLRIVFKHGIAVARFLANGPHTKSFDEENRSTSLAIISIVFSSVCMEDRDY